MTLVKVLLLSSLGVLMAGTLFTAACAVAWPAHLPLTVVRVSSAAYLAGVVLLACGVTLWIARERRSPVPPVPPVLPGCEPDQVLDRRDADQQ